MTVAHNWQVIGGGSRRIQYSLASFEGTDPVFRDGLVMGNGELVSREAGRPSRILITSSGIRAIDVISLSRSFIGPIKEIVRPPSCGGCILAVQ